MWFRHFCLASALLVLLSSTPSLAQITPACQEERIASGLNIERLAPRQRQHWEAIKHLALAEDSQGHPLHPTLRGLWEWIETSGHLVYVEIVDNNQASTCTAGSFGIERLDPTGERHVAVIKLYLRNIDRAYVGPHVARANGFIPFDRLSKEERYAEVLGHELAHAAWILGDQTKARMVEEVIKQTNELLLSRQARRKGVLVDQEMQQRLLQRDRLLKELEEQAETMEAIIWQEILASQKIRRTTPGPREQPRRN
jgi:hypothetical protein